MVWCVKIIARLVDAVMLGLVVRLFVIGWLVFVVDKIKGLGIEKTLAGALP